MPGPQSKGQSSSLSLKVQDSRVMLAPEGWLLPAPSQPSWKVPGLQKELLPLASCWAADEMKHSAAVLLTPGKPCLRLGQPGSSVLPFTLAGTQRM